MKWLTIIFLLLLIACAAPQPAPAPMAKTDTVEPVAKAGALDIATAVKLGKPIKCVTEQQGQTSTMYMKGSMMRMDTMPADAHAIYTSDMMYTWNGKQGMMMKMEDIKNMAAEQAQAYKPKTPQEVVSNAEQNPNARCEAFEVPQDMFTPPSDVKFEDLAAMMNQIEGMTKDLKK